MSLAKDRAIRYPQSSFGQSRGAPLLQEFDPPAVEFFGFKGHHETLTLEDERCSDPTESYPVGYHSDLNSSSSNGYAFGGGGAHWAYSSSSVLSFDQGDMVRQASYPKLDQEEECGSWVHSVDQDYHLNHLNKKSSTSSHLTKDVNCFEMTSGGHEDEGQESGSHKRQYMGDGMQSPKRHCGNGRKAKAMPSTPSKDPQSLAAKNRRERISERLKTLQELVPNGTKVDLVTMLEKAISYVKFLQLQVKVLATDEFWPAQGGKAPEVAQVKEAIDAILASHR